MPIRPLPVIAGVVRCSVKGQTPSGQPWINVVHFQYAGGASAPGPVEINNLDPIFFQFYSGTAFAGGKAILGFCRNLCTTVEINYTPLDGTSLSIVKPHAAAGTAASTVSTPSEVAVCVSLRTNTRGKRYRGRIFLPPMAHDTFDGTGSLGAGNAAQIVAQWAGMSGALVATQWVPVVASYGYSLLKDGSENHWTPFATPVMSAVVDLKADVQRRRK